MTEKDAVFAVSKPYGMTSHDVIAIIRKTLLIKKVGHAGTLDPLAEGVLVVLTGKKTKESSHFMEMEKEYVASIVFGEKTETGDREGRVIETMAKEDVLHHVQKRTLEQACRHFLGNYVQTVPLFSAVKRKGKRLYSFGRSGTKVPELPKRSVEIKKIQIISLDENCATIKVICGKGVYIRQLVEDIGSFLQVPATLDRLVRTRVGQFQLTKALYLIDLTWESIRRVE